MNTFYVYIDHVTGSYKGKDRLVDYIVDAEQFLVQPPYNVNYKIVLVTYHMREIAS